MKTYIGYWGNIARLEGLEIFLESGYSRAFNTFNTLTQEKFSTFHQVIFSRAPCSKLNELIIFSFFMDASVVEKKITHKYQSAAWIDGHNNEDFNWTKTVYHTDCINAVNAKKLKLPVHHTHLKKLLVFSIF